MEAMDSAGRVKVVLENIERLLEEKGHVVLAIDGTCGSGKTFLSHAIRDAFPCNLYHTDDFYLPYAKRPEDWIQTPCANMDFDRLREEVLIPASEGRDVLYRPYDCPNDLFKFEKVYPFKRVSIVEGNYSFHPSLYPYYDLTFFLTLSKEEQTRRLMEREQDGYSDFETTWVPLAEQYFTDYEIREKSSVILNSEDF